MEVLRELAKSFVFQFTHPVWGATLLHFDLVLVCKVSIHAPRVGCDLWRCVRDVRAVVSIHAPRVGCDVRYFLCHEYGDVSIHAPRVGCDYEERGD